VPGVRKDDVEINLDQDVLTISGRVALDDYNGLRPVYSEFNVGNFFRRFSLGETIDQAAITADMDEGVLTVTLPKREQAQPRKITVA
jgi:HSP20 family molecular chaperone IbpA